MYIKKIIIWGILSCILLTACSKTTNVKMVSNTTMADKIIFTEDNNEIKICVDFIYDNDTPNIEINGLIGTGLEDAQYEGKVIIEDFEKDFSYKDNSLCSYIVTINAGNKKENDIINIEGILLNIDGEDKEIEFENALKYTFIDEKNNNAEDLQSDSIPSDFCGIDTDLSYAYKAGNDITINSINTNGLLNIDNLEIYVNDNYIGDLSKLPIELSKGDRIAFNIVPQLVENQYNWTNVYTNMIVNYSVDNKEYVNISDLSLLPIESEDDIKEVIDFMLK